MRRFSTVCAALSALLAGCFIAAQAIGARQTPTFHAWLAHADGAPCERACLFGVTPDGTTTFDAARERLADHPLTQGVIAVDRGLTVLWRAATFELSIGRDQNSAQLMWINLLIKDRTLRMSDMLAAYGTPDYVKASNDSILTDLIYTKYGLQVSALREALPERAPLRLAHRVYNVYLVAPEPFEALMREIDANVSAWRGLVSIKRYIKP